MIDVSLRVAYSSFMFRIILYRYKVSGVPEEKVRGYILSATVSKTQHLWVFVRSFIFKMYTHFIRKSLTRSIHVGRIRFLNSQCRGLGQKNILRLSTGYSRGTSATSR